MMPGFLGLVLRVAILCFLIVYFTRGTDADRALRQAIAVVCIVIMTNIAANLLLYWLLGWGASWLGVIALYFAVRWLCDTSDRETAWIVGGYVVANILIDLVMFILLIPT